MYAETYPLALPRLLLGAERLASLESMAKVFASSDARAEKDVALSRIAAHDPSLLLELVEGPETTWIGESQRRPSYLLQALERDWPMTVDVVLRAGLGVDQAQEFGNKPLISLRGCRVVELPSNNLPSSAMLSSALAHGYPADSKILRPIAGRFDTEPDHSLLYEYTCALQMATGALDDDALLGMIRSVRSLIEAGANEFDPIKHGSNFAAVLCTSRFLTDKTSPEVFEATVQLLALARSRGASIDRRCSDDAGTVLVSALCSNKTRMAVALIEMGCDQDCSVVKHSSDVSPGASMTLSELATWRVGPDGCAAVLAAVMRRQIAVASSNSPAEAPRSVRKRMAV